MIDPATLPSQLEAFISDQLGRSVTVTDVTQITGGYSRYMARCHVDDDGQRRGYVLRADPPPGQSILETDRTVEWQVLQALHGAEGFTIPEPFAFDERGEALGSPAILSEEVTGATLLASMQRDGSGAAYLDRIADVAAGIHSHDPAPLPDVVTRPTSWADYIDAEIERWAEAEAAHAEREPFMRLVGAWLRANRPPEVPLTLVHGDFQAPNLIITETGDVVVVDWEIARIGDPREDLGWWALAAKSQPPDAILADEDAFYRRYRELTGFDEDAVNPATVAYFTVLSSAAVFFNLIRQTAAMSRGETTAMSIAYMTNAMPFMHGVWIESMRKAGAWSGGRS